MSTSSVFLLGPGFVGGAILAHLQSERPHLHLSVLVRKAEQAAVLQAKGITPVLGSLDDADILTRQAAASDIIINASSNKHLASVQALAAGVARRDPSLPPTVYIHTSGNGVFTHGDQGVPTAPPSEAYRDDDPDLESRIPDDAPHRSVDIAVKHLFAPVARVAIVSPPLIYGINTSGPLKEHRYSVQIPTLIKAATSSGQALVVGKGTGVWNVIHVEDLATAYLAVLAHLEASEKGTPDGKIYFLPETEVVSFGSLSASIGNALHKLGIVSTELVRQATPDEQGAFFGPPNVAHQFWADNARVQSVRLAHLGWTKSPDTLPVLQSVEKGEVQDWVQHNLKAAF